MAKPKTKSKRSSTALPPPLEEGDFYLEGGFMVFTREYHLKRGFCCKSGCRHCPWNYKKREGKQAKAESSSAETVD